MKGGGAEKEEKGKGGEREETLTQTGERGRKTETHADRHTQREKYRHTQR